MYSDSALFTVPIGERLVPDNLPLREVHACTGRVDESAVNRDGRVLMERSGAAAVSQ